MIEQRWTGVPLRGFGRRPDRRPLPDGPSEVGVLLVDRDTPCLVAPWEAYHLAGLLRAELHDAVVEVGPGGGDWSQVADALDALVARGCRRIVTIPLALLVTDDEVRRYRTTVAAAAQRHPGVELSPGCALDPVDLVGIAGAKLAAVGGLGLPLLVIAGGSSDASANAEAARATRLLSEWVSAPVGHTAFATTALPTVPVGLEGMVALAAASDPGGGRPERVAVFHWFVHHGHAVEQAREEACRFRDRTGIEVVDAAVFGPDPLMAELLASCVRHVLGAGCRDVAGAGSPGRSTRGLPPVPGRTGRRGAWT